MDTERLRGLAASYRLRANLGDSDLARTYENKMACYLESIVAWIEMNPTSEAAKSAAELRTARQNRPAGDPRHALRVRPLCRRVIADHLQQAVLRQVGSAEA